MASDVKKQFIVEWNETINGWRISPKPSIVMVINNMIDLIAEVILYYSDGDSKVHYFKTEELAKEYVRRMNDIWHFNKEQPQDK